jgi:hypothetical protein
MAHAGGRPVKFKTCEELKASMDSYFDSITINEPRTAKKLLGYEDAEGKKPIFEDIPVLNNAGEQVIDTKYFKNPSIISMCLHIGITRETLRQYEQNERFSDAIKEAKAKIEEFVEQELYRGQGQVTGIIFNLKNNFGWVDKQEIDQNVKGEMEIKITGAVKEWGV